MAGTAPTVLTSPPAPAVAIPGHILLRQVVCKPLLREQLSDAGAARLPVCLFLLGCLDGGHRLVQGLPARLPGDVQQGFRPQALAVQALLLQPARADRGARAWANHNCQAACTTRHLTALTSSGCPLSPASLCPPAQLPRAHLANRSCCRLRCPATASCSCLAASTRLCTLP